MPAIFGESGALALSCLKLFQVNRISVSVWHNNMTVGKLMTIRDVTSCCLVTIYKIDQ